MRAYIRIYSIVRAHIDRFVVREPILHHWTELDEEYSSVFLEPLGELWTLITSFANKNFWDVPMEHANHRNDISGVKGLNEVSIIENTFRVDSTSTCNMNILLTVSTLTNNFNL